MSAKDDIEGVIGRFAEHAGNELIGAAPGRAVLAIVLRALLSEIADAKGEPLNQTAQRFKRTTVGAVRHLYKLDWNVGDDAETMAIATERQGHPDELIAKAALAEEVLDDLLCNLAAPFDFDEVGET